MDVKVAAIEKWLFPLLASHVRVKRPFTIGLSGVQGSGKSTIVTKLQNSLISHGFKTAQFSLDDLYLTFDEQVKLSQSGNKLWGSRGQFGTHDVHLAKSIFSQLSNRQSGHLILPSYDKSQHQGRGDRASMEQWPEIEVPIDVLIFEGWGVGFQPLTERELTDQLTAARADQTYKGQLLNQSAEDLRVVNDALRAYCDEFMGSDHLDAFIMLQAEQIDFVYEWRLQQEHAQWATKGSGMTDRQVREFVDRYYTSYELYLPRAVEGFFLDSDKGGRQIDIILDKQRNLIGTKII